QFLEGHRANNLADPKVFVANALSVGILRRHGTTLLITACRLTIKLSSGGRAEFRELRETSIAAAICCNALIIIMTSLGWAGSLSQGYKGSAPRRRPHVGSSGRTHLPTTMRAQTPTPIARRP